MAEANDPRPRPQYGEYADETEVPAVESAAVTPQAPSAATPAAESPAEPQTAPSFGPLPGVPHNLGVTPHGKASAAPAAPGEPYRAAAPSVTHAPSTQPAPPAVPQQPAVPQAQATPQTAQQPAQPRSSAGRSVDRISTIILLVVGAYSALNSAFNLMQFRNYLAQLASAFGVEDYVAPQSVGTLGQVGALTILALYAVTLIYSIQRLRARKLAFWVPLAAGAIAFVLWLAFSMIAFVQSPELLQAMSQPDAMQKLLAYLESQGL